MIGIIGAKGRIENIEKFINKTNEFSRKNDVSIQAFDANLIFGKMHIISAYEHAKRAFERLSNTTNSIEMETLLYASGERQIQKAIKKMGIKKGHSNIAFVIINNKLSNDIAQNLLKELNLVKDDNILEGNINTLQKFGISAEEISTVSNTHYQDIILEKVALVDIIK